MIQRMIELDPAAGYPGVVLPAHFQFRGGGQRLPGLLNPLFAGEHLAGEDQSLRLRAALGETAFH